MLLNRGMLSCCPFGRLTITLKQEQGTCVFFVFFEYLVTPKISEEPEAPLELRTSLVARFGNEKSSNGRPSTAARVKPPLVYYGLWCTIPGVSPLVYYTLWCTPVCGVLRPVVYYALWCGVLPVVWCPLLTLTMAPQAPTIGALRPSQLGPSRPHN